MEHCFTYLNLEYGEYDKDFATEIISMGIMRLMELNKDIPFITACLRFSNSSSEKSL